MSFFLKSALYKTGSVKRREFFIRFNDYETMPERIESRAAECGVTPEQLICRAITQYMGEYGLKSLPGGFEAKSMHDLFEAKGLVKSGAALVAENSEAEVRTR